MTIVASAALRLAAETSESHGLREGMGNILFTIIFLLLIVCGIIWWLKRNYG
jgi:heme/copper-type cytochrome/quinol oxidase subunit 4